MNGRQIAGELINRQIDQIYGFVINSIYNKTLMRHSHRNYLAIFIVLTLTLCLLINSQEHVKLSDLSSDLQLQWSFVSEIYHTWVKNIINSHFTNCTLHQQLNVLYNCNTTTEKYKLFWSQFLQGIQTIKFKQATQQDSHQWSQMMIQAANQWITVNKVSPIIEIEQAYQDIKDSPSNLMHFAQFYSQYQEQFQDMQKTIKWQRVKKSYLSKKGKNPQQMEKDQMKMLKKYFDKNCFNSENYMTECKMPLERYSYYLKDMFFYYFEQPQTYAKYDKQTESFIIDPLLDYKITKLWRDMRQVMTKHLNLSDQVTLEEVENTSVDILQSVMESLVQKSKGKIPNKYEENEYQNNQL